MKKILMFAFFLLPLVNFGQNIICLNSITCNGTNNLTANVSTIGNGNYSVNLSFSYSFRNGSVISTSTRQFNFQGSQNIQIPIPNAPTDCNLIDYNAEFKMYAYQAGSTQVLTLKNGNCTGGNQCCINPYMSVTARSEPYLCSIGGFASVTVSGGQSPYRYLWNNGATTSSISGVNAGTYSVIVTDALGFTITKSDIVVANNCVNPCNVSFRTEVNGYCRNQLGTIKIVVESGRSPFNVIWTSNGFSGTGLTIYTSESKTYTITVTDGYGCKMVKNVTATDACPPDCPKYIDNCRAEWEQFILKNYASAKCKQWETVCDTKSDMRRDGKVAIGLNLTSVPDGFNLAVKGGVITNDVKVKLCGSGERWCDYVFDKTYKLMLLADVSKYIHQNKHLPNMPSTADIDKENGYEIKKLALLQQEKIEEAYLHLIKLEETVRNLTNNIEIKRQRNNKIVHLLRIENEK